MPTSIVRKWTSVDGLRVRWQVILPSTFRSEFIKTAYTEMSGGNLGCSRTEELGRLGAYWPGWISDVRSELKRCAPCSQYHRGRAPRQFALNPFPAGEPFETVSIDITGKHPKFSRGNYFILTVVDSFSKFAKAYPLRVHTAPVVAKMLASEFFPRYGTPIRILSDQGPELESELFRELCCVMEIDKVRTTPY